MSKYMLHYDILISCPSDMQEDVRVVENAIDTFNKEYASFHGVQFNLRYWSKDVLFSHGRPQDIINEQIVMSSDMIIALFGRKLGSDTGKYKSGTIEEIQLMIEMKKPTLVCFSNRVINSTLDTSEIEDLLKVRKFQEEYNGLYITYKEDDELQNKIEQQLKLFILKFAYSNARQTPICSVPFAYQEDQNDRETILDASEITFCARTGKIFIMGNYNSLKEFLAQGGKLNFLSSDNMDLSYDDKGEHLTNANNSTKALLNLHTLFPGSVVFKKLQKAPNVSMLKVISKSKKSFIDVKFNFQSGLQTRHPLFTLNQGNPFYDIFDKELSVLWDISEEIDLKE